MVIRFYLDRHKTKAGLQKVLCEIKNSGWVIRLKTGLYARAENWNQAKQQLRSSHPNQVTGNALLTAMRTEIERLWLTEIAEGREPFPATVKAKYLASRSGGVGLFERLEEYIESKDKDNTARLYSSLRRSLREYEAAHRVRIDFSNMSYDFYDSFRRFLKDGGFAVNTIALRLSTLKAFLHHGHKTGWHNNATYRYIRATREKSKQVVLTAEEVEQIISADLPPNLQGARDAFVFQIYTGIRASDLNRCTLDGNTLTVRIKKVDKPIQLTVNDTVTEIWHRYDGHFRVSINHYILAIKEVCRLAGVRGKVFYRGSICEKWEAVGSHTARRTCAALLYEKGVALKSISLILGHASVTTTEDYLRHLSPGGDVSGL